MANNLVIVESPTKARTLGQFLGDKYQITASMGHIRDLPKSDLGIDLEHDFEPLYVIPKAKRKQVGQLEKMAQDATHLYLATDPDREGEAIAWHIAHLATAKNNNKTQKIDRVVFHEITKDAVKEAFDNPRNINQNLVNAQQARRVLDRIVGYKLSPLLWKKIRRGLSAGRVQSVTVRLIVEREREIEKFKAKEYWLVDAEFQKIGGVKFNAQLIEKDDKKLTLDNEASAKAVLADLDKAEYKVKSIKEKEVKKYPSPPFTTSTLQQAASNKFGFTAKKTMAVAQELYERGLITYMRTDSVNLADSAISSVRQYIVDNFGQKYLPSIARKYRVKSKVAQEAHEAIRPTKVEVEAEKLEGFGNDHKKLYDLIRKRMLACQMVEAVILQKAIDIAGFGNGDSNYTFRANGSTTVFDGWRRVYGKANGEDEETENVLPQLKEEEIVDLVNLLPSQHFTQPPDRYTEASLIKTLELNNIGRPSTYAPIISTILERQYVERIERKFHPTNLGIAVNDFLVTNFEDIVDMSFTAEMEEGLDEIARGEREWQPMIGDFYGPFEKHLLKIEETAKRVKVEVETTDEVCEKCGKPMVIRIGRFGKFLACSGFPDCKNTKALVEKIDMLCPKDGGNIIVRKTKRGRPFYGCSNWPNCDFASWTKPEAKASEQNTEVTATKPDILPTE